ncbi:hypothetical protein [Novosphingobium sp. YAF33]|uniref:hypothetical protein n=1 Tax=Novosphingobium sp. YAF33 TaxID=3233082 RepID=UPI003F953748
MQIEQIMQAIREGFASIPTDVSHVVGRPPAIEEIFTPVRHSLALDPDLPIVVGARGTGKSFWASVFTDQATRNAVAPAYPRLHLANVEARPGFVDQAISTAVSKATLDDLARDDEEITRRLWLILAIRAAEDVLAAKTFTTLEEGLSLYKRSETTELRLHELDTILANSNKRLVVVFDALDRLSNNWDRIRVRTTTLLETLLAIRAYRSIKFKLFMRPEQLSSVPSAFTDLSKLKAGSYDLRWHATDLYALAFSNLIRNPSASPAFNELLISMNIFREPQTNFSSDLPYYLMRSSDVQERVFNRIAGAYMGADARRGKTYSWLPKHLSDTKGRLTPRSFLTALGAAARHERMPTAEHALTIDGIKHGVSEASVLRVDQLKDEYGWIDLALQPLAGQEVPCEFSALFDRWSDADTLALISSQAASIGYLPPFTGDFRENGMRDLLVSLMDIGVLEIRSDNRVNIPDLFRIAALMLRRGGLRPLPPN